MSELNFLKDIIYKLVLTSENRTTDILELIVNDELKAIVTKQGPVFHGGLEYLIRESMLYSKKKSLYVSQNIAIIYSENIPQEVFSAIIQKKTGLGKIMKQLKYPSTREIVNFGFRSTSEIMDVINKPHKLIFNASSSVPFKEYKVKFKSCKSSGIHLIEYFNPEILSVAKPYLSVVNDQSKV